MNSWRKPGFGGLIDEACAARGNVYDFADEVGIYSLHEIFPINIDIIVVGGQFCRVVVPQILGFEMSQIRSCVNERPARLRHFPTFDRYKSVRMDTGG